MPTSLKPFLDELYQTFDRRHLASDPLAFAHRYDEAADQEVVAFLAAGLAFGHVRAIETSLERLLDVLGPRAHAFVRRFDPARQSGALPATVHRWISMQDVARTLVVLREVFRAHGSLEAAF
ncbi:MAG: DUF2400 family protein, partial [Candidatus Tectimicrobiota bacterium]